MNFDAPGGFCPFFPPQIFEEKKNPKVKTQHESEMKKRLKEREVFLALSLEQRAKVARKKGPKAGYCECCRVDFTDPNKV